MKPPAPYATRLKKLRAALAPKKLDAILISQPENRRYLSGFKAEDGSLTESSGHLLITARKSFLLTDFRYAEEAEEEALGFEVQVYRQGLAQLLAGLLPEMKVGRLGFESDFLPFGAVKKLAKALKEIKLAPTEALASDLRTLKDNKEIKALEASLSVIEAVLDEAIGRLKPGVSEQEAAWWIIEGLKNRGAAPAFPPIVASGPNASKPHAVPTTRRLKARETIILDVGARVEGYCSDITRTVWLGRPTKKFEEIYAAVRRAQRAALEGVRPNMTTKEADALARKIIEEAGFGPAFGHGLGHGVGLATHEAPSLSPLKTTPLRKGMVFTVEPGVYLPGWGGVRLEVMAALERSGCRPLGGLDRFYNF